MTPSTSTRSRSWRPWRRRASSARGREKLAAIKRNANYFRKGLNEAGFWALGDFDSPVIPIIIEVGPMMYYFSRLALESGIALISVGWPATPFMFPRVRFCISAAHTKAQLDYCL